MEALSGDLHLFNFTGLCLLQLLALHVQEDGFGPRTLSSIVITPSWVVGKLLHKHRTGSANVHAKIARIVELPFLELCGDSTYGRSALLGMGPLRGWIQWILNVLRRGLPRDCCVSLSPDSLQPCT